MNKIDTQKKEYGTPTLTLHGDVETITQAVDKSGTGDAQFPKNLAPS